MKEISLDHDATLRSLYKHIKFCPKSKERDAKQNISFDKSVSFDTMPSTLGTSKYYGEAFKGVTIPTGMKTNLKPMKGYQELTDIKSFHFNRLGDIDKLFDITEEGKIVRRDYPSRPMIINDSLVITQVNRYYKKSWQGKKKIMESILSNKIHNFKYPNILFPKEKDNPIFMSEDFVLLEKEQKKKLKIINTKIENINTPRTIICHINGRKHTWVALDWLLYGLINDNDHVIILTNLPVGPRWEKGMDNNWNSKEGIYDRAEIISKIMDIFEYCQVILKQKKKIVKVSIDISIGKTKQVILDAINLYTPDIIISSTLKWERQDQLINCKSNLLKDKLCTSFPIPVVIVPARRMYKFELDLQNIINNQQLSLSNCEFNSRKYESSKNEEEISPLSSYSSLSSTDSLTAGYSNAIPTDLQPDSFSKYDKYPPFETFRNFESLPIITRLYLIAKRYRSLMNENLIELDKETTITSKSERLKRKIDIVVETSLKGSLKIDKITGHKKILSDKESHSNKEIELNELKGFTRLKRVITGGSARNIVPPRPMVDIANSSEKLKDKNTQIKFATDVKFKDGKKALGHSKRTIPRVQQRIRENHNLSSPVRKVVSSETLRRYSSNDSEFSSMSTISENYSNQSRKLPFLTKEVRSAPTSRRNSSSNSNENKSNISGSKAKRSLAHFFGMK